MTNKKKTINSTATRGKAEFQPERYDTSHLDCLDGHVSDFTYRSEKPQLPAVRQNLVLPARQELPAIQQRTQDIAPNEAGIIGGAIGYAIQMASNVTGRATQGDSADTLANAQVKTGAIIVGVCFVITAGLVSVVGYALRTQAVTFPVVFWIGVFLLLWGGTTYAALRDNHRRIMDHSGSGVERLRIVESNETARAITNRAFDALERKWGVYDRDKA